MTKFSVAYAIYFWMVGFGVKRLMVVVRRRKVDSQLGRRS